MFCFRHAFAESLRLRLRRPEIRISLRTAYRCTASYLAIRLSVRLKELVENASMNYVEIRARMNQLLMALLEPDDRDSSV
ncbi:DUF6538 domain-containing protein [Salidesulfovibrio brasiliensis]|uniref:DUF6538 domain-containing protein n=1 Tax=Salidesulfovibrio brasiliensis TaxID=221711 RepID=UPI0034E2D7FF